MTLSLMRSMAGPESTPWDAQANTSFAPPTSTMAFAAAAQAAGRVDHVIEQQAGLALDVADDVHDLGAVGLLAALVHDGQTQAIFMANERARATLPTSGETTTRSSRP